MDVKICLSIHWWDPIWFHTCECSFSAIIRRLKAIVVELFISPEIRVRLLKSSNFGYLMKAMADFQKSEIKSLTRICTNVLMYLMHNGSYNFILFM